MLTDAVTEAAGARRGEDPGRSLLRQAKKGPDAKKAVKFAGLLNPATVDAEMAPCDLVIEAVVENPEVKQQLYARLEPQLSTTAILASNTSTIPITKLAEGLKHPERFCGIHFFNPVRQDAAGGGDSRRQDERRNGGHGRGLCQEHRQVADRVNDGPGFLVNRLLLPYMNEALELFFEGAEIKDIERAAKEFGMPMGPITLYDVVGLDTAFYAGRVMCEAFPDRMAARRCWPPWSRPAGSARRPARASFAYKDKGGRGTPDPALADDHRALRPQARQKFTSEQIIARLFLPMMLEATRILEANRPQRARRGPGPDLRHRLPAVQRRPAVLGRHARRGQDRRNAQAAGEPGRPKPADPDAVGNGQDRQEVLRHVTTCPSDRRRTGGLLGCVQFTCPQRPTEPDSVACRTSNTVEETFR